MSLSVLHAALAAPSSRARVDPSARNARRSGYRRLKGRARACLVARSEHTDVPALDTRLALRSTWTRGVGRTDISLFTKPIGSIEAKVAPAEFSASRRGSRVAPSRPRNRSGEAQACDSANGRSSFVIRAAGRWTAKRFTSLASSS